MALGKKTGGRAKGVPNKTTAEVKAYAGKFSAKAIDALVKIMDRSESDAAKVAAANAILDRAHGKPAQMIAGDPDGAPIPFSVVRRVVVDPQLRPSDR
jgi:cellobiose-specific phosphotransferase system component IIA